MTEECVVRSLWRTRCSGVAFLPVLERLIFARTSCGNFLPRCATLIFKQRSGSEFLDHAFCSEALYRGTAATAA
jgi:hypothetical protein